MLALHINCTHVILENAVLELYLCSRTKKVSCHTTHLLYQYREIQELSIGLFSIELVDSSCGRVKGKMRGVTLIEEFAAEQFGISILCC